MESSSRAHTGFQPQASALFHVEHAAEWVAASAIVQQDLRPAEAIDALRRRSQVAQVSMLWYEGFSGQEEWFDPAMQEFQAVIDAYGDGINPQLKELAGDQTSRACFRKPLIQPLCRNSDPNTGGCLG